ncbi:hypothetical protein BB558_003646 [Smittium angustum]|uniref:Uncharacterized protein n=1 Tax=Smittium angustum TaxID=133377 RepID=A0A2U1J5E4_SMIAN|nr:hypothetical protein BB558_003646 [Smittium angustum]
MYTVGLDTDTFVSPHFEINVGNIKLYSGNLHLNYLSPLGLYKPLGKILNKEQSVGNQLIEGYSSSIEIIKISDHIKKHNYPESDIDFGYYLAGLIEDLLPPSELSLLNNH